MLSKSGSQGEYKPVAEEKNVKRYYRKESRNRRRVWMNRILFVRRKKKKPEESLAKNYRVHCVDSDTDAWNVLDKEKFDAILLWMEEDSAIEEKRLTQWKDHVEWNLVPVIAVLPKGSSVTEEDCFEWGMAECLKEPLSTLAVCRRLEYVITLFQQDKKSDINEVEQNDRILNLQHEVIWSMANLIESRDGTTGGHVKRTWTFVWLIGRELLREGKYPDILTKEYFRNMCEAAPLHDIGKIAIPDYILKGTTRLTKEEFEEMKDHAALGGKIIQETMGKIEDAAYLKIATDVACYHHEKWDGAGYPKGLKGEEIPLCARIMAVADVLDALAFRRSYKEAMDIKEAIKIIVDESGTHFDPTIVNAMLAIHDEIEKRVTESQNQMNRSEE